MNYIKLLFDFTFPNKFLVPYIVTDGMKIVCDYYNVLEYNILVEENVRIDSSLKSLSFCT